MLVFVLVSVITFFNSLPLMHFSQNQKKKMKKIKKSESTHNLFIAHLIFS